jgi:hypothetical protein
MMVHDAIVTIMGMTLLTGPEIRPWKLDQAVET